MENTKYPNNLLPIGFVFTTFIICVFIVIAIITITNFEWLKEAYSWIINNNKEAYSWIINNIKNIFMILSIIILFLSLFLYPKLAGSIMRNNTTNKEVLDFLNLSYTIEDNNIYIKKDFNYWFECVEKITVLIAMVSIYLTIARFFSTDNFIEGIVSIISILIIPIPIALMYSHYSMKILLSLIWAAYPPVYEYTNKKLIFSISEKIKIIHRRKGLKITMCFLKNRVCNPLLYIFLVTSISTVMIFYFPIIIGVQMAPTKQEPLEYCQIKNLPPQTQNHCKEKK